MNEEVAEKLARFRSVFIPYPQHIELHGRYDFLQRLGRRTRGQAQMGLRVLAPSGSGKTTATLAYMAAHHAQQLQTSHRIPIIKVDLERGSTSKKFFMSTLDAFGDPYASYGNELTLKRRLLACIAQFGTELLVVDEVQHLNYRNGVKNDVTDTLKALLDAGVVPIVFLGTEDAQQMFERNLQLNGRLLPPCDLHPLSPKCASDRGLFSRFVETLEQVIVDQQLLPQRSSFARSDVAPAIFEVSSGVIGRVSRLFQVALEVAIRRGSSQLEASDISWAIDHWAVPQAFVKENPLRRYRHA